MKRFILINKKKQYKTKQRKSYYYTDTMSYQACTVIV